MVSYLYWQYFSAPRWLLTLYVTLQRALWQYFSVGFMIRTLLAYWRRDSVRSQPGLGGIFMALAWNAISRVIGLVVRISVIVAWVMCSLVVVGLSAIMFAAFLVWPLLLLLGFAVGIALTVQGL